MSKKHYQKIIIAILLIIIGILSITFFKEKTGSIGIALMALGGLLFISVMKKVHKKGLRSDKGHEEE